MNQFIIVLFLFFIFIIISFLLIYLSSQSASDPNNDKLTNNRPYKLLSNRSFFPSDSYRSGIYVNNIDLANWAVPSSEPFDSSETGYYTNNINIKNKTVELYITDDQVSISDLNGTRNYPYSTSKIVSTSPFLTGLFICKVKVSNISDGIHPYISLRPFHNVSNNQSHSIYGKFPSCGQIDILKATYINNQIEWYGNLHYGSPSHYVKTPYHLPNHGDTILIGLEWTDNYIAWYSNPKVDFKGYLSGTLLHKVKSSDWYTLTIDNKKILPPAPFNVPFHLDIGISVVRPETYPSTKMVLESIEIYQR